jgi:hypothetical protein
MLRYRLEKVPEAIADTDEPLRSTKRRRSLQELSSKYNRKSSGAVSAIPVLKLAYDGARALAFHILRRQMLR